jgi:hypothetical protein
MKNQFPFFPFLHGEHFDPKAAEIATWRTATISLYLTRNAWKKAR